MSMFFYRLIDSDARLRGGLIDLPFSNPLSAITYLERQGSTVLFVNPLPPWAATITQKTIKFFQQPITRAELGEALVNVSVMLRAGVPLLGALEDSIADHDNPTLSRLGKEIIMRVEGGSSLTDAVASYPDVFPSSMIFLIRLGEESGSLERTIKDAGEHLKRMDRIMKDTRSALIYPAFIFTAIFGAMAFWLIIVVPVLQDLFRQQELKLPEMTLVVMAIGDFLAHYVLYLVGGIVAFIMFLATLIRNFKPIRRGFHFIMLKLPVVKRIVSSYNLAFITEYLSLLLTAGVDIFKSLDTMGQSLHNEIYREKLVVVRNHLVQGIGLRESFKMASLFPNFMVRMIGVGEQSGTLSEQLGFIANEYRLSLDDLVKNIGKIIEPIALAVGGGLFMIMIVALFTPVYQLIQKM
ncbi:MAG: type II secretion system F family protein [Magnetococcales bacterium]|nr:type II secretion system F family protein [Magnetococcales bacterium]